MRLCYNCDNPTWGQCESCLRPYCEFCRLDRWCDDCAYTIAEEEEESD